MMHSLVLWYSVIVIGIFISFLALFYGIKENWKLSKAERRRSANRFIVVSVAVYFLCKFGGAYMEGKTPAEQPSDIIQRANTSLIQNASIKECANKVQAGEIKSNVANYLCRKPYIMQAYRDAGIRHNDSLVAISDEFLEIAIKSDKGETPSGEELFKYLAEAIKRDKSEP